MFEREPVEPQQPQPLNIKISSKEEQEVLEKAIAILESQDITLIRKMDLMMLMEGQQKEQKGFFSA